ncbi:MAG: hypothetical protein U5K56_19225 [Halioglobus sp.]|nr:hypothetical protein [Halioglobus sp.]
MLLLDADASPDLRLIEKVTGKDLAGTFIHAVEKKLNGNALLHQALKSALAPPLHMTRNHFLARARPATRNGGPSCSAPPCRTISTGPGLEELLQREGFMTSLLVWDFLNSSTWGHLSVAIT